MLEEGRAYSVGSMNQLITGWATDVVVAEHQKDEGRRRFGSPPQSGEGECLVPLLAGGSAAVRAGAGARAWRRTTPSISHDDTSDVSPRDPVSSSEGAEVCHSYRLGREVQFPRPAIGTAVFLTNVVSETNGHGDEVEGGSASAGRRGTRPHAIRERATADRAAARQPVNRFASEGQGYVGGGAGTELMVRAPYQTIAHNVNVCSRL
jgi:hypothetical protein